MTSVMRFVLLPYLYCTFGKYKSKQRKIGLG